MNKSYLVIILGVSALVFAVLAAVRLQSTTVSAAGHETAPPGLMGIIRDANGKPLNGVAVSARSSEQTFTTSVYTDDQGEYVFPSLSAGNYELWAQAVGFSTGRADVTLDGSHTGNHGLTLKPLANFEAQLTGAEWYASLPDDTANHRRLKQVLYVSCSDCHGLDLVLQERFDEAGWLMIVKSTESSTHNGWLGKPDLPAYQLHTQGQIIRYHRDELARYLAEMRGPGPSPMTLKTLARPSGDAARVVVTEFDLPVAERANELAWYSGSDWTDGPASCMHGIVGSHDVFVDAAGIAWISQAYTSFETNRTLTKLDPKTGQMTAIKLMDPEGRAVFVEQMGLDPRGNIWMHNSDYLIRLTPSSEKFAAFAVPRVMARVHNSTDSDSQGRIFINGPYGVVEFDPAEQSKTGVAYPGWHLFQQLTPGNGVTYGVTTDADDNVWWSEAYADKVAKRDMKTGKLYEMDMHDPNYDARKALATKADLVFYDSIGGGSWGDNSADNLPYANMPRRLSADKHGNTVWVPNWADSNLAEIDIHTMKVTYHPLPVHAHPYQTNVDKQHNVWTDVALADAVFKFSPATHKWTIYPLPSHGCGSRHHSLDGIRGELWLPCDQANKVARFQFRTAEEIRAQEAAAHP